MMCSMDSDELAEDWEANLDPILRLLRSKLITELIDTYIYIKGRDETVQCQPSTALTASGSSAGSGQDSTSNTSPISKPSNATSFGKHERPSGEVIRDVE